jgi:hypothetical protein
MIKRFRDFFSAYLTFRFHFPASDDFFSSVKPEKNNSPAAMQMHESATLKVGHHPWLLGMIFANPGSQMLMKSTT